MGNHRGNRFCAGDVLFLFFAATPDSAGRTLSDKNQTID
jgi:hypothetical protein